MTIWMLWRQSENDLKDEVVGERAAQKNEFAIGILGGSEAYMETHTM